MSGKNKTPLLVLVAFLLTLGVAVLTFPMAFGLSHRAAISGIEKGVGYSMYAPLPSGLFPPAERVIFFPEEAQVFEDGIMLRRGNASLKAIERGGWGRSGVQKSKIYFSTSDRRDLDHQTYQVSTPILRVPEWILIVAWLGALGLWIFLAKRTGMGELHLKNWENHYWQISIALFLIFIFLMVASPAWMADGLFLSFWLPVLWALSIGMMASGRRPLAVVALGLLAVSPAVATYIYYAMSGSSHDSFLVAGVLPWSDARMHFLQAAEIAREGITQYPFNGRFLYPAYFSSLLWMGGWNLSLANALAAAFALGTLGLACWTWRSKIGAAGTGLFALLCWLYFREFGCGLVMTEVLGFACGILSLACLYWGCEKRKLAFFFLGLFWMSMGSSARPGALFVLPLLGISAGWLVWSWDNDVCQSHGWKKFLRPGAVVALAALIVVIPFGLNSAMGKMFYKGEAQGFGNFAFTLNGLLTGTKWSASYEATHGNVRAVMTENIRILKKEPQRLAFGIQRAYETTFAKFFFYRFGEEKRLADSMKWLAVLGVLAFGMVPSLRPHAPWIWAGTLGVILSVPFAPPWDAGVRPYAATVGLQSLLPGAGLALVLRGVAALAGVKKLSPAELSADTRRGEVFILALSISLIALAVMLPLARAAFLHKETVVAKPASWPPQFRSGSVITLGNESGSGVDYENYQKRLAIFSIGRGDEAKPFADLPRGTQLGINWNDLQTCQRDSRDPKIPAR